MVASSRSILPVKVDGVTVRKRGKTILDAVSMNLDPEGFTIVMGPNGAGKTTFLRLLHGLERPKEGDLRWNCDEDEARKHRSFVFQIPTMLRRTVLDNIAYPLTLRGTAKSQARATAKDWADKVGLGNKLALEAGFLSGGEQQKLAIARALITRPVVLFLDEPTANLDGTSTRDIEAILSASHKEGTRLIMTTHDVGQAKRLASEVVFLNRGKICEQTAAKSFFMDAKTKEAQAYLNGDIL